MTFSVDLSGKTFFLYFLLSLLVRTSATLLSTCKPRQLATTFVTVLVLCGLTGCFCFFLFFAHLSFYSSHNFLNSKIQFSSDTVDVAALQFLTSLSLVQTFLVVYNKQRCRRPLLLHSACRNKRPTEPTKKNEEKGNVRQPTFTVKNRQLRCRKNELAKEEDWQKKPTSRRAVANVN